MNNMNTTTAVTTTNTTPYPDGVRWHTLVQNIDRSGWVIPATAKLSATDPFPKKPELIVHNRRFRLSEMLCHCGKDLGFEVSIVNHPTTGRLAHEGCV